MKRTILTLLAGSLFIVGMAAAQENALTAVAYGTVNVRSGPGTQFDIVGQLAAGDRVPVTGRDDDGDWLRIVIVFGQTGWVASFAVMADGNILELPIVTEESDDDSDTVTVTAYGTVNVRSGPGMSYPIIGQLDADDTLPVLGRSGTDNDWLYIQEDDTQGWVAFFTVTVRGKTDSLPVFTVSGSGQTVVPENNVIRTRFNVRLREAPSMDGAILAVVPFRSVVTPLARTESGDWLYVLYKQTSGWGVADLFDISDKQLESLPIYNAAVLTPTPTAPTGGR
jgi:uncharacterized protein YraI